MISGSNWLTTSGMFTAAQIRGPTTVLGRHDGSRVYPKLQGYDRIIDITIVNAGIEPSVVVSS